MVVRIDSNRIIVWNVMTQACDVGLDAPFHLNTRLGMICGGRRVVYPKERTQSVDELSYDLQTTSWENRDFRTA